MERRDGVDARNKWKKEEMSKKSKGVDGKRTRRGDLGEGKGKRGQWEEEEGEGRTDWRRGMCG